MRAPSLRLLVVLLTAQLGCFDAPDPTGPARDGSRLRAVRVEDDRGAAFAPGEVPRTPVFRVTFAPALSADLALDPPPLQLVPGVFTATFVTAAGTRLKSLATERARPMTLALEDDVLVARPEAALEPGAPYTLLWLDPHTREATVALTVTTSASPALGAAIAATFPAAGAQGVPPNLARVLVALDGHVDGALTPSLSLVDAAGAIVPATGEDLPCASLGLVEGSCAWLVPAAALAPGARHEIVLGPGVTALTGAPVPPTRLTFTTSATRDDAPPALRAIACAPDEQPTGLLCARAEDERLHLRGSTSEEALVTLALSAPGALPIGTRTHASEFTLPPIRVIAPTTAQLRLGDLAGQVHEVSLALAPGPPLAPVSIDEVRADPRGKEPAQEYVELLNSGTEPVSLMGYTLSTSAREKGRSLGAGVTLGPGARALVVAPDFDPAAAEDGALPAGVPLVRLDRALSLRNEGERLFLRDAAGRRVSAASTEAPLIAGQCSARLGPDRRDGAPRAFALDPSGGCTPGAPTFLGP